ncbi:MAG: nitrilase-related carbon-nitrogen hydrolase [Rhodospirillaceae bacterium]
MLVMTQQSWSTENIQKLDSLLSAAQLERTSSDDPLLVLLPLGESTSKYKPELMIFKTLASLAKEHALYLAGAAPVIPRGLKTAQTIGFLFGPDGEALLRVPKVTPDYLTGFSDTTCELGKRAKFPTAKTPLGVVGLLVGEDIFQTHLGRALTWHGAEIILNPAIERRDYSYESRLNARLVRAYENLAYVACATPSHITRRGNDVSLPPGGGFYSWTYRKLRIGKDETFLSVCADIETLRIRRQNPYYNPPVHVRANLYVKGLQAVKKQQPSRVLPKTKSGWIKEALARQVSQATRNAIKGQQEERYDVLVVQPEPRFIQKSTNDPKSIIQKNLEDALSITERSASGPTTRLLCYPEFFLHGQGGYGRRTPATFERIAISFPGPESDQLGEFCAKNKVYIAGSALEKDPKFPGRVFNCAFIINDSGDLIHRYRKIHCADVWGFFPDCTPGSIFTQYVDVFGYDYLFPVADTPLGKLATMVCFDHTVGETARMLVHRGAEVIIHCTSDPHGADRLPWELTRQTRGFENTAYILAPRNGGEYLDPNGVHPSVLERGYSRIIHFDGSVMGEIDTAGRAFMSGSLDLRELRMARQDTTMNSVIWDDPGAYAAIYANKEIGMPLDVWAGDPYVNPYQGYKQLRDVLERYNRTGVYQPPRTDVDFGVRTGI